MITFMALDRAIEWAGKHQVCWCSTVYCRPPKRIIFQDEKMHCHVVWVMEHV